jgi:hypothetical protein
MYKAQVALFCPSTTAWRHPVIPAVFWRESSHTFIRPVSGPGFPPEACGNDDRNARRDNYWLPGALHSGPLQVAATDHHRVEPDIIAE